MKLLLDPKIILSKLPENLLKICEKFHKNGHEAYIVGGSIRDLILGYEVSDFDLTTDAHPDVVMALFRHTVPTGIKHGTITVFVEKIGYEITTFRFDGKYIDGRHPENVTFAKTLQEDLKRRDFTINAIAFDIFNKKLIDLHNGVEDLEKKTIKTIGNPIERFMEDGLRPVRACRFASKLEFEIEKNTFDSITQVLNIVELVSKERVRDELLKIIQTPKPSAGLELLRKSGILGIFMPELLEGFDIKQNRFHKYDVYYHNLYTCDAASVKNTNVRLAALFHDLAKPVCKNPSVNEEDTTFYNHEIISAGMAKRIMKRLKFSNDEVENVTKLIRLHMFHYTQEWTDGAVRRFIRKAGLELIPNLFALREADRIGNGLKKGKSNSLDQLQRRIDKIIEEQNAISLKDLKVNGFDIMKSKNISPGPEIGKSSILCWNIYLIIRKKTRKNICSN